MAVDLLTIATTKIICLKPAMLFIYWNMPIIQVENKSKLLISYFYTKQLINLSTLLLKLVNDFLEKCLKLNCFRVNNEHIFK